MMGGIQEGMKMLKKSAEKVTEREEEEKKDTENDVKAFLPQLWVR